MHKLLVLFSAAATVWPGGMYVDTTKTFQLRVPAGYGVENGKDKPAGAYLAVCHAGSAVCLTYPQSKFSGTNFGAASIEVTFATAGDEKTCIAAEGGQPDSSQPSVTIDGVKFAHTLDGDAGMSHNLEINRYRGFDKGKCFELATALSYTDFGVYPAGQMKEFTADNRAQVTAELQKIVFSFHVLK
jgi:hypothetical protein